MPQQRQPEVIEQLIRTDIEHLVEELSVPGVAFGAEIDGHPIHVCTGVTHVEHPLSIDENTVFQIASMSKPFTATLVMLMVQEAELSLDDPVIEHVADFSTPDHLHDSEVTIRHLLTHTTGWDGDHLFVHPTEPPTLATAPAAMADARRLVDPGTEWTYNNAGFSVAGRVVENLTGQSFDEALRARILDPLEMDRTFTTADEAIGHRVAMRHVSFPDSVVPIFAGGWQPGWQLSPLDTPAGGMLSTTSDLLKWLRCWVDPSGADALGLDQKHRTEMLTQSSQINAVNGQGVGWAMRSHPGGTLNGHGGLTAGYCSYSMSCPELGLTAAVLTNSTGGASMTSTIIDRLIEHVTGLAEADPFALDPQPDLVPYCGSYWGSFGTLQVSTVEGELEFTTTRHNLADGGWQPPPEPPKRVRLYDPRHGLVVAPEAATGGLVDFESFELGTSPGWVRAGGRIHPRIE